MTDKRWKLMVETRYSDEGFGVAEIEGHSREDSETFGCDRLCAMVAGDRSDGAVVHAVLSVGGPDGKGMEPMEMFHSWVHLAEVLLEELPPGGRRALCAMVVEMVRGAVALVGDRQPKPEDLS